jgi:hypothetical protein
MLLSLEEATFDVFALLSMPGRITSAYRTALLDATTEGADCICSTAPFFISNSREPTGGERSMYGALLHVSRWYKRIGSTSKARYGRSIIASQYDEEGQVHDSSDDQVSGVDVDGYMLRRLLWQDVIGGSVCAVNRSTARKRT